MNPIRFALVVLAFLGYSPLVAQSTNPIRLNKHYFEIDSSDSLNHQFNKIVSYTPDSVKIERIFTLENRLVRIQRTAPKNLDFQEYSLEQFDENGELIEKTTANLANSKYLTTYFKEGQQVGQVMYRGESKYRVYRKNYSEPKERLYNDFEPNPIESKKVFGSFISEKVTIYPSEYPKQRQMAAIAVFINEKGEVTQLEWANPLGCEKKFADRYLKAVKSWKEGYTPALDENGNPVAKWRIFQFHFGNTSVTH